MGCPVRADLAPLRPAEQPAPHAIVVRFAFEQHQVCVSGGGGGAPTPSLACVASIPPYSPARWTWLT